MILFTSALIALLSSSGETLPLFHSALSLSSSCSTLIIFLFFFSGAMESGIVGGKEVKAHSRPYMASLQSDGDHKCGGFLIRKDFVLTAAHSGRKYLEVVLGAHNIKKKETNQQRIQVRKYFMHPNYNKYKKAGDKEKVYAVDIMLLKGDSGGPLMCNTKPSGLAIYTSQDECNNPQYPGVYLNISAFLDWIKKVMGKTD
ncbi:mast cell protease 1A-like [Astyanax mexicanus]|uniref:trypsin n=1 Tax=Astyanax mexicanus TaxID=7994 RepID=A0A8T2LJL7_ASTMX|nr:mast cell protease 1A-like [Astyanax mexicanus]